MDTFTPFRAAAPRRQAVRRARATAGFTIIEVFMATFVMLFGISSAILVTQSGYRSLDTARNTTLASQILQSEMERIRLLPWDTTSLDASGNLKPAVVRLPASETINLSSIFPAGTITTQLSDRFTVTRTCTDVADRNSEMKSITITVAWRGIDGVSHSRKSSTQYAKNGLYDYYYTKAKR